MAEPISNIKRMDIPEETIRENNLEEVIASVSDNKNAILKGIEVLETLNQSGMLDIINAFVKHRHVALEGMMNELDKSQYAAILDNLPRLVMLIGELNVADMEQFAYKLNHGVQEAADAAESEKTSYMDLIKALKDPEINRSITMMLQFLRGMGKE